MASPPPVAASFAAAWARTWITRLLAVVFVVPFALEIATPGTSSWFRVLAILLVMVSFVTPSWAIVLLAGLLPLGHLVGFTTSAATSTSVVVVPAVLIGAYSRLNTESTPPVRWTALVAFAALVLLSAARLGPAFWFGGGLAGFPVKHPAVIWLEGLALAALTARLARHHAMRAVTATRVLIVGAGLASLTSLIRLAQTIAGGASPMTALLTSRLAPNFADVNAAGSFLALFTIAAATLWLFSPRRWRWPILTLALTPALWLTGSRAALISVVITAAFGWVVIRGSRGPMARIVTVISAAGVLAVLLFVTPPRAAQASTEYALSVRVEMANIALEIAAAHPWLGAGIGQFQQASTAWITSDFVRVFPPAAAGENAHNNFLQILAELGIPGLVVFIWMLAVPVLPGWRAVRAGGAEPALTALWLGTLSFLITCLAGHPLLSPDVLLTFLFVLGTFGGLAEAKQMH